MFVNIILVFFLMYALEARRNIPFLYTFTLVKCASILFLFVATDFGLLYYAKILWACAAVISFASSLYIRKPRLADIFSRRHYAFIAAMGIIFLLFYNGKIMGWDPFFWADFSKYIQIKNDYWSLNSIVFYTDHHLAYPPGFALFSSIFMGLFPYREFSQYLSFVTPLIFMALTVIKLGHDYLRANNYVNFLLVLLCFGLLKTLGHAHPINFLSADIAIAAFFTTCLLVALFEKNISLATLFLAFTLPAFTLLKSTCVLLSLSVVLIFFVRIYAPRRKESVSCLLKVALICVLAVSPLLIWEHVITARAIASTSSHLSIAQVLSFFDQMDPAKTLMLRNLANYFFLESVIYIYPAFLQPLTSTFALLVYASILLVLSYRKEKGRQLAYLACLLGTFAGWIVTYVLVITFVLPDALADYIVSYTYKRYVGQFICPLFAVAVLGYALHHGQAFIRSKAKFLKVAGIILMALMPLYALGIYQRAHPPVGHQSGLLSIFKDEYEENWRVIDAAQQFIIQNTPAGSRIWTVLNKFTSSEGTPSRSFMQLGFDLHPYRENHLRLRIKPEMSDFEARRTLIEDGATHVFFLYPGQRPLQAFGDFVPTPQTACPVLMDIRPWKENVEAEANGIIFYDAPWCKK